jgi:hypothetical protein
MRTQSDSLNEWARQHPVLFQIGPVVLTTLVIAGSAFYNPAWPHYNRWPVYVILCGAPGLLFWHATLIVKGPRWFQFFYAVANLGAYVFAWLGCRMTATGEAF